MTNATSDTRKRPERGAHLRWVRLGDIHVNPAAQREFNQSWATQILANFDLDKFTTPTLSHRDDKYYIVDGQHGTWAYRAWSGDDPAQQIQAWVHAGLTEEQEAELFLSLNNRRTVGAIPKFKAAVTAGRFIESDVDRIVRAQGCIVTADKVSGSIRAVAALTAIYRDNGPRVLAQTISAIREAYGDEGYESDILRGVALVLDRYDDIEFLKLVQRLRTAAGGSKGLINRANTIRLQTGNLKSACVAAAVVEIYNRGRGGKKLQAWWKDAA